VLLVTFLTFASCDWFFTWLALSKVLLLVAEVGFIASCLPVVYAYLAMKCENFSRCMPFIALALDQAQAQRKMRLR